MDEVDRIRIHNKLLLAGTCQQSHNQVREHKAFNTYLFFHLVFDFDYLLAKRVIREGLGERVRWRQYVWVQLPLGFVIG